MSDEGTEPDLSGVWLAEVDLPVLWHNMAILRVEDSIVAKGFIRRRRQSVGTYTETFQLCGLTLPKFTTVRRSTHQLVLPDNMFDQDFFPASSPYPTRTYGKFETIGLKSEPLTLLGGAAAAHASGPWPAANALAVVDTDYDGYPGFTVTANLGGGLQPFTTPGRDQPIAALFVAMRLRFRFDINAEVDGLSEGDAFWAGDGPDLHIVGGQHVDGSDLQPDAIGWLEHHVSMRAHESGSAAMRRVDVVPTSRAVREAVL